MTTLLLAAGRRDGRDVLVPLREPVQTRGSLLSFLFVSFSLFHPGLVLSSILDHATLVHGTTVQHVGHLSNRILSMSSTVRVPSSRH